jgi:hypothetical protein
MRKSKALSMAINREKKKTMGHSGTIPKSTADIIDNLPERFKNTSTGTPFLRFMDYVDGEQSKLMLIFMSDHGAWVLGRSCHIYCDGTFDTCPEPFSQLYFIMGQMDDTKRAVPCVYALLPDKEGTTYLKMWNQIKALVTFQDGLPTSIMSDFEKAVLNTMGTVFPEAAIRGCNFHQKQAIRRNIQAKGLQSFLNHSAKFMYFVKMVYGLAFVPPDQVGDIFDTVLMDYLDSHRQEEGFDDFAEELEDFVSYLQRTWIGLVAGRNRTRRQPMFAVSTWNKFQDILSDQQITNNSCEGVY